MMKIINNLSIKYKLLTLFTLLCISIAILGYKAISLSQENKKILKDVHSKSQETSLLQKNFITPLYTLREQSQSLIMAPNKTIRITLLKDLDILLNNLDKKFIYFKNSHQSVYKMWKNYKYLVETTKEYLKQDFEEGAYVNITTSSRRQFNLLVNELLTLQVKYLNNASLAYDSASKKAIDTKIVIASYVIFILVISIIVGLLVSSNILNSIQKVQYGLNDFFDYLNRDKKRVNKIDIQTNDEFGQMASVINENMKNIENNIEQNEAMIKDATQVLGNIKRGNLGTRITQKTNNSSLNELKNKVNNVIDNLEVKIQEEIDKRLEQEEILIQQSKLASMGEMIGNIAHQWRQPIAQISAILMNMKVTYDFDKFDKPYLDKKLKEANTLTSYMSQTISDFQNFFKPQGKKEEFSIKKACNDAYLIIESSLKYHGIEFNFHIKEDILVYGYKNEYCQVILNVLSNAKDALIERKIKNPKIEVEIKQGDNYAIVKISDNAQGIKPEILEKIFEPYFTTRHKTQGTGIGLYMSKNIIERNMNGYINAKNTQNGALFTIKVSKE